MRNDKLTRRDFVKKAAFASAGLAVGGGLLTGLEAMAQESIKIYLPLILKPPAPSNRVTHVHDSNATYWNFGSNYYGNYVRQDHVNNMVDQGVMTLTDTGAVADAWRALIPSYTAGVTKIAIKVNFNNCFWCTTNYNSIDALIHPINALIGGLQSAYPSLNYSDIWIYEATIGRHGPGSVSNRGIPTNRFRDRCLYSGVRFFDAKTECNEYAGYDSSDPSVNITWRNPGGIPTPPIRQVTDVLVNATYLINIPIMKKHGGTEVTLSFKNHAGSISNFAPFHDWTYHNGSYYSSSYNPLVDIYRNSNIQDKTVLTIADGLFGNWYRNDTEPQPWEIFGGQAASSLLFATDPVAIDCVMCDLLNAENVQRGESPLRNMADDYLVLAAAAGLGTYERGNPLQEPYGSGYSEIEYMRVEL